LTAPLPAPLSGAVVSEPGRRGHDRTTTHLLLAILPTECISRPSGILINAVPRKVGRTEVAEGSEVGPPRSSLRHDAQEYVAAFIDLAEDISWRRRGHTNDASLDIYLARNGMGRRPINQYIALSPHFKPMDLGSTHGIFDIRSRILNAYKIRKPR
jgi:hypothetical protein